MRVKWDRFGTPEYPRYDTRVAGKRCLVSFAEARYWLVTVWHGRWKIERRVATLTAAKRAATRMARALTVARI